MGCVGHGAAFPLQVYIPQGFLWHRLFAGTSHSCGIIDTGALAIVSSVRQTIYVKMPKARPCAGVESEKGSAMCHVDTASALRTSVKVLSSEPNSVCSSCVLHENAQNSAAQGFVELTLGEAGVSTKRCAKKACSVGVSGGLLCRLQAFTCGLTVNSELLCWGSSLDFELDVPCQSVGS